MAAATDATGPQIFRYAPQVVGRGLLEPVKRARVVPLFTSILHPPFIERGGRRSQIE
jgi:hypothetical protein